MYALKVARRISRGYGVRLQILSKWTITIKNNGSNKQRNKHYKSSIVVQRRRWQTPSSALVKRMVFQHNKSSLTPSHRYLSGISSNSGLAGVIVCDSKISTVGHKGAGLMYYGYSINDLALNCEFEEIAYLLTRNKLPNKKELKDYKSKLNEYNDKIAIDLIKTLEIIPKDAHPMDVLKITCCFLGTQYNERNIFSIDETMDICDRLLAIFPTAMCYHYRYHFFNDKIDIKSISDQQSIAERIICLLNGNNNNYLHLKGYKTMISAINKSLICYAEHGVAASTFCARVTASTLSDTYSSICSGICTLKGNLHGGANEAALQLIDSFNGNISETEKGINKMLNDKELIMGFGHRIYKNGDPRSSIMKDTAILLEMESEFASTDKMNVAQLIEEIMFNKKSIYPNMDFYASMLYNQCGITKDLFTPIFVCSRTSGWTAHIIEQRKNNKLIRPNSNYIGSKLKKFVNINDRE